MNGAQQNGKWQIGMIFVFTLLFSGSCALFTQARRQEVFVATAAYCIVFVVFLGSSTNVYIGDDWAGKSAWEGPLQDESKMLKLGTLWDSGSKQSREQLSLK